MTLFLDRYRDRSILVTGHTGFKGSWLALWLSRLGARVTGYALAPPTEPNLFTLLRSTDFVRHEEGDIRDLAHLGRVVEAAKPDVVFHLAAQPLVRLSYEQPLETLSVNVLGTATVLEALRGLDKPCAVVVVTSDKCYENRGWPFGYRETDPMGGHDPYSMSKGCAELVTSSWRRSYLSGNSPVAVASARAGNVIGGGDWARDRIVTDCIEALRHGRPIGVRSPFATRPWQHVLEPLSGYLWLGALLQGPHARRFADAWNFGPAPAGIQPVRELVRLAIENWGAGSWLDQSSPDAPHEAHTLALCCDKAHRALDWWPTWDFADGVRETVRWYRDWHEKKGNMRDLTENQIERYAERAAAAGIAWTGVGPVLEDRLGA